MKLKHAHTRFGGAEVLEHATIAADVTERRLVLPNNAIVNGNFVADSDWTYGTGWDFISVPGAAYCSWFGAPGEQHLSQMVAPLTTGLTYRIRYDVFDGSAGPVRAVCGTNAGAEHSATETVLEDILANGAGFEIEITNSAQGWIDNVSATVMPGDKTKRMHLRKVHAGYDSAGAPAGSSLIVEWTKAGTVNYFTWYPPSVGTAIVQLPPGGIIGDPDTLIILTLSAGDGSIKGKVHAFYEWI